MPTPTPTATGTAPPVPRGLLRVSGAAGVVAGTLIVTSQLVELTLGLTATNLATEILTVPATLSLLTKLLGFVLLPLALVGAYLHEAAQVGRSGLIGLLAATTGAVLTAGDWWFEAFGVTWLARSAPEVLSLPPSTAMAVAAHTGFGLLAVGAVLLGLASVRARVFPRWTAALLAVGGVPALIGGSSPFLLLLGCAVAVIGWCVLRGGPRVGPGAADQRLRAGAAPGPATT